MTSLNFDALVVGGGIIGRCALYHLQRLGLERVGLVEQFGVEHNRGSSHSHSRITRSAYVNAGYVRLMQVAHTQEWPRIEAEAGQTLILPTDGCCSLAANPPLALGAVRAERAAGLASARGPLQGTRSSALHSCLAAGCRRRLGTRRWPTRRIRH